MGDQTSPGRPFELPITAAASSHVHERGCRALQQKVLRTVMTELGARVFAVENRIIHLHFNQLVIAYSEHTAHHRFFFSSLRDDQAGRGAVFLLDGLDKHPRTQRLNWG